MKLYIVKAYSKAKGIRYTVHITDTEEKAETYISGLLTEYEKQKTKDLRHEGALSCSRILFTALFLLHNVRLHRI